MAALFTLSGGTINQLNPVSFGDSHTEVDLQRWADENPHLLNDGRPMLTLGTEITTKHNHSIDNLYLDGNGHLVVAELKKAKTPRDVTAQVLDYGAYANGLDWDEVELLCRKQHGKQLRDAYNNCFGSGLDISAKPEHRLLIVAESFDESVIDASAYLINTGVPLALLGFRYFELGGEKLFDFHVILGDIPEQAEVSRQHRVMGSHSTTDPADTGRTEWLLNSIKARLPEITEVSGLDFEVRLGQQTLSFAPRSWNHPFGECQFRVSVHVKQVGIYFSYKTDAQPHLFDRIREQLVGGGTPFDEDRLVPYSAYTTLSHLKPMPVVGDANAIDRIVEATTTMVNLIDPLVAVDPP